MADDKQWASKYLLDPLTAPQPADEDGPGTSFTRAPEKPERPERVSQASTLFDPPSRKSTGRKSTSDAVDSPKKVIPSGSVRRERASDGPSAYRYDPFEDKQGAGRRQRSVDAQASSSSEPQRSGHHRRTSSLTGRFPGDTSHQPLNMIKQDTLRAHRSPHLRRGHIPGSDSIDKLDLNPSGGSYHHEGPFDAALLARNTTTRYRPIDALRSSNAEALRATPRAHIVDSLERHRPLEGVATIPPGEEDFSGKRMQYEEGTDLMIEAGYKRWADVNYLPGDLKGKGEPSYSIEKALKDYRPHRRGVSEGGYEMMPSANRSRSSGGGESSGPRDSTRMSYREWEQDIQRSNSDRRPAAPGLRKRLSLRKK